ncbi:MAG: choice-of-anchor Q domain-containing protein [Solirubrobacterales bacterium]
MALLVVLPPAALANIYRPTRTGDPVPNGCKRHDCSLREAVITANALPGADKIVLKGGKTYNLRIPNAGGLDEDQATTGDLDLLHDVTITHSGKKRATIDAHGIDSIFHFPYPAVTTKLPTGRLIGLVIRGGRANPARGSGGGIDVDDGHLVLVKSVVSGNRAQPNSAGDGIDADLNDGSSVRISRSRISGNSGGYAGGIWTSTPTSIRNSTVSGNTAAGTGGITSYDTLTVVGSTIAGNKNTAANAPGGGVYLGGGTGTFTNDTIANNTTGGGGGGIDTCGNNFCGATAKLNAVTIARNSAGGNGGGIYEEQGVINVRNSLIALNQAGPLVGPDCDRTDPGGVVSQGHNLIGDTTDCGGAFGSATHDITDVNPRIGKLADNGGPTKTIALRRHSKAINHAGSDAPPRDQRGVKRRVKGDRKPDIGALERR